MYKYIYSIPDNTIDKLEKDLIFDASNHSPKRLFADFIFLY